MGFIKENISWIRAKNESVCKLIKSLNLSHEIEYNYKIEKNSHRKEVFTHLQFNYALCIRHHVNWSSSSNNFHIIYWWVHVKRPSKSISITTFLSSEKKNVIKIVFNPLKYFLVNVRVVEFSKQIILLRQLVS